MPRKAALLQGLLAGLLGAMIAGGDATAAEYNPVRTHGTSTATAARGVIVKFRATAASASSRVQIQSTTDSTVAALATRAQLTLQQTRRIAGTLHVMQFTPQISGEPLDVSLARLRADPAVEYAELDVRRYPHAVPNDPLFSANQWYLQNAATTPSAVDAVSAWDVTTGSTGVVIAELDTGVRFDHPDLLAASASGRLLPGYNFISDPNVANDGNGRDSDASDPGDWVTSADTQTTTFNGCTVGDSSWHGTRVAGILGALTNNSTGIAGINWKGWTLPVRVLGKCGGYDSDIVPAMLWAGGIHVDGVPDNPYPAQIENMSLGSATTCSAAYADAISQLAAKGVLVVVSAGNEGGPVDSPANCAGAVGIAGLRHAGTKVGYSSLGTEVALSAPAGNCVNTSGACIYSIGTTINLGTTTPGTNSYTDQINYNVGTSFSAPIVAGIAGLMKSVNGNLTGAQLIARLKEGATKPFPVSADATVPTCHVPTSSTDKQNTECNCTTSTCGAGMANAKGSVQAALRPIAAVAVPATVSAGQNVSLSGAGSAAACGHSVKSYSWTNLSTNAVVSNTSTATVVAPSSSSFTVELTVTDDAGLTDKADVVVSSTSATSAAPTSAGTTSCLAALAFVSVSVSPSTASVQVGTTQSFTAAVANASDTNVSWQVNNVAGGNATYGTISSAGVYTAPATVPSSATVTIAALSEADPTRSASAQVTITPASSSSSSSSSSSGGGGGGALDLLTLVALSGVLAARRRR